MSRVLHGIFLHYFIWQLLCWSLLAASWAAVTPWGTVYFWGVVWGPPLPSYSTHNSHIVLGIHTPLSSFSTWFQLCNLWKKFLKVSGTWMTSFLFSQTTNRLFTWKSKLSNTWHEIRMICVYTHTHTHTHTHIHTYAGFSFNLQEFIWWMFLPFIIHLEAPTLDCVHSASAANPALSSSSPPDPFVHLHPLH